MINPDGRRILRRLSPPWSLRFPYRGGMTVVHRDRPEGDGVFVSEKGTVVADKSGVADTV